MCVYCVCVFFFVVFFSKEKKKGSGVERVGRRRGSGRVWEKESDLNILYENRFIFNKMCFFIKR